MMNFWNQGHRSFNMCKACIYARFASGKVIATLNLARVMMFVDDLKVRLC